MRKFLVVTALILCYVMPGSGAMYGQATKLIITGAATQVAGVPQDLTIQADSAGVPATSYSGPKTLTFSGASSSTSPVTAPTVTDSAGIEVAFGGPTVLNFVNGVASVSAGKNGVLKLYKVESAVISATDGSIQTTGNNKLDVAVSVGSLEKFALVLNSPQTNNVVFTGTNTLTAQDSWGNTVTTFNAATNHVTMSVNSLSGTVAGLGASNNVLDQATNFSSGVADLDALGMRYVGLIGTGSFKATSTSPPKEGSSASVTINPGTARKLVITGSSSQIAGQSQNPTITAKDTSGNTATSYDGSMNLTYSGAASSSSPVRAPTASSSAGSDINFGSTVSVSFSNGIATSAGSNNGTLKLYKVESATISVTDGTISTSGADRLTVSVTPGTVGKFAVFLTSPQTNGTAFTLTNTVTAQDSWGNTVTGFDASATPVTMTPSLVGTVTGLGSGNNSVLNRLADFSSGVANLTTLGMVYTGATGSGTFTASSTSPSATGISNSITISAGAATRLVITGQATQTAGITQNLTITAKDGSNNTVTSYTGSKSLTFSGANASTDPVTTPKVRDATGTDIAFGSATSITFTNGVATVSGGNNGVLKLYKAETAVIAVTDGSIDAHGADQLSVIVSPDAIGKFSFALAATQQNNVPFANTNTLTAEDEWGNIVTTYNASVNPVAITAAGVTGNILGLGTGGNNTLNQAGDFSSGVANLRLLGMKYLGTSGSATFTATSTSPAKTGISPSVTITPGVAKRLALNGTANVGAGVANSLTITAQDTSGNTATGYAGLKSLSFSGANVSPDGNAPTVTSNTGSERNFSGVPNTDINFTGGVASVSGNTNGVMRLRKVESASIAVTDGSISTPTGGSLAVTITPAGLGRFAVVMTPTQINGVAFTGVNTITAIDSFGNTATSFSPASNNVTVTAPSLSGTITGLGSGSTNVLNQAGDFVLGIANVSNKIKYTGSTGASIFRAASVSGKEGLSASVTINVGSATRLVLSGSPTQNAGDPQSLTITAKDSSGNTVTSYAGAKSLVFSGSGASPNPATAPTVTASNGTQVPFGLSTTITFSSGVATVSGSNNGVMRLFRAGKDTIAVSDGSISAGAGDRLIVTINPSVLAKFLFSLNSPQQNGVAFAGANTLTAQDAYGNTATGFDPSAGESVTITPLSPLSGTVGGLGSAGNNTLNQTSDFVLGVANLTGKMKYTGIVQTGLFTAASVSNKVGSSGSVQIVAGGATRLVIRTSANDSVTTLTAGGTRDLLITAKDASNNTVTTYTGSKSLTFDGADSSLSPASPATVTNSSGSAIPFKAVTSITFSNGVATVSGSSNGVLRLLRAQAALIQVSDGTISSSGNDRLSVTVSPSILGKFTLALQSPQTNTIAFTGTNTLTALDDWGNTVTTFNASTTPVTMSTPLPGSITGLGTGGLATLNRLADFTLGVADLSGKMKYTGAVGSGTFTANGGGKTGQSALISIVAGGATRLVLRTSAGDSVTTMTAGTSRNLVITAKDGSGNIVTAYTGAKNLQFSGADSSHLPAIPPTVTNSGGTATAFGANTAITFTNGVAQVTGSSNGVLRLYHAQSATIVVTDGTILSDVNDRLVLTVGPGALGKFLWALNSSQTSGVAFTGVNTLTAQDDWGNPVTSFDASTTNVSLSTSLGGTITGLGTGNNEVLNRNIDFSGGAANLTALGMKYTGPVGTGVFTATAAGKAGTSDSVVISAGLATHLVLTGTGTQTAGTAQNLTITARDESNNIVIGYAGTKTLTFSGASPASNPVTAPTVSNSAGAAIPFGASTLVTFTNGTATVSGGTNGAMRLYKVENAVIAVTDGTIFASVSDRLTVAVSPGALGQFSWTLAPTQTNGVNFTGTNGLVAQDDWGNTVPTFNASTNNVTITSTLPGSGQAITGLGSLGNNVLNQATNFSLGIANLTALGMRYTGSAGTGTFTATSAVGSKTGTSATITMNNPAPTVTAVAPAEASRLQTVTVGLTGTNFVRDVSRVSLGSDVTIDTTIVDSTTHMTVRLTPAAAATLGLRSVSVTNATPGGGTGTLAGSFLVKNVPSIISLGITSGIRGATLDVFINGTNFADGVSTVGIQGSNITLNSQTIINPSTIRANITISLTATDGVRYFTVTNAPPQGGVSNQVGFTVGNNPAPTLVSVKPDTISRLQTVELTLRGTDFYNGITSLNLGAGITVNGSVLFDSTTQLRVNVTVTDTAASGLRNVSVMNVTPGGGTATLTNRLLVSNPVPTFTGLSVQNGSRLQTLSLTLSGTRFIRGVTQTVFGNGITVNSSNVDSPAQMTVDITIDSSAALGARNLSVLNPAPGGGTVQLTNAFTVNNPTPTITAVTPESTLVGGTPLNLVVTGTNFVPGSAVWLGTTVLTSTLANRTRINAAVPASELDTARTSAITVVNTTPGGGTSNSKNFAVQNPAPTLASLTPANGSRLQTLDVVFDGTNFVPGVTTVNFGASDITVNGSPVTTATRLTANITISSSATIGPRDVTVSNPAPGGGTSEKRTFTVANNPVPAILTVTPSVGARLHKDTVVVTGANFIAGVTSVEFGSGITATTPVVKSATQLTTIITISVNAATGPRSVSVTNAAPGGGTATKVAAFTVNNPAPTLVSVDPASLQQLDTKNVTFDGSGFIDGVSNLIMGDGITVNNKTVVSDSQMTASITVTLAALTGPRDISITNNPPGGGTAILTNGFSVGNNPKPTLVSISPATGKRLETLDIVFRGTNFMGGNVTRVDLGSDITVNSYNVDSDTSLTANVTIRSTGPTGARTIYLRNLPPGGGVDSIVNGFTVTYPVPVLSSATPSQATRNQTINITLRGSNFLNGITTAVFGAGIVVNSVTADSATRAIANVTISPSATLGARNLVVTNPAPGGGNSNAIAFTVNLAAPPTPTLTSPQNGKPNLPEVLTLRWDSSSGATQYHVQVSTSSLFQNMVVDDSSVTTPSRKVGPLLNNQTYYWRVRAKNGGGVSSFSSTWSFTPAYPTVFNLNYEWLFPTYSLPGDYKSAEYQIVGLPGRGPNNVTDYFGNAQGTDWQMYWDNGDSLNYLVSNTAAAPLVFSTGRAFWLVKKSAWTLTSVLVNSPVLDTAGMALVPVHKGFNLITNPFAQDVPWSAVQLVNGNSVRETIWEWKNEVWQQSATLKPYVGYYFYNADTITQLKVPYAGTSGVLKTADSTAGWMLTLGVNAPEFADRSTQIGVRPDAEDDLDAYDHRRPRMFGSAPALMVMRPDLDSRAPGFATEFRKSVGALVRWNLNLYAQRGKEVTLDVTGAGAIPAEYEVYLVDHLHAKFVDLRTQGVYPVVPVTDRTQFSVLVGSHAAVQAELGNIVPRTFALDQNFPNPFNPTTTIGVAVPVTGAVTVKIYNILGEEIVTLHDGVLEQGRHWLAWDGRNGSGSMVATGVYLTRMTTPAGGSHVIKMMLLK